MVALRSGDRATWLKLGRVPRSPAELTGEPDHQQQAPELVGRTAMLATFFGEFVGRSAVVTSIAPFRALAAGERGRAVRAMSSHLPRSRPGCNLFAPHRRRADLDSLIGEYAAELGGEVSVG